MRYGFLIHQQTAVVPGTTAITLYCYTDIHIYVYQYYYRLLSPSARHHFYYPLWVGNKHTYIFFIKEINQLLNPRLSISIPYTHPHTHPKPPK